jgi:cytochrome c oxidase assembly factor CtaG
MSHPLAHWSWQTLVVLLALGAWYELGRSRLGREPSTDPAQHLSIRRQVYFHAGLITLLIAFGSPLDWWGYRYFYLHTVQHLLLMFAAPSLIAAGAPWRALAAALPDGVRGALGSGRPGRALRAARGLLTGVWFAAGAFNLAMVGWAIPGALDYSERSRFAHVWLANGGMFVAGLLFWLLIIDSPPLRVRPGLAVQAGVLLATNVIMWGLAMAMSLFAHHSWYSVYDHVHGVALSAYGDQLLGAGILWVCGDFWAVPALVIVVRRLIAREQGDADAAIERILGQGPPASTRPSS